MDYRILGEAAGLPRNVGPSDIDFVLETRGKVLFGELKTEGKEVPPGQQILLSTLAKARGTTVFVLWLREPSDIESVSAIAVYDDRGHLPPARDCTFGAFARAVGGWWRRSRGEEPAL